MDRIVVHFERGAKKGQVEYYPLNRFEQLAIGRDAHCDVRFEPEHDVLVSRHHAAIEWDRGVPRRFVIADLLSSNGTFLNGKRLAEPTELRAGDLIEFGVAGPMIRFEIEYGVHDARVTGSLPKVP
jgi:predicted component of type VI protein secretion system